MKKSIATFIVSILLTIPGNAQTWYTIDANTTQDLEAIDFVDDNPSIGYIGGDDILLKTADFGETWNTVDIVSLPQENSVLNVHDIHFFDENNGIMTSDYQIWETTDGGLNWSLSDIMFNCFAVSLHFINDNLGFVGGSGCFEGHVIMRIENGEDNQANDPEDWTGATVNHVTSIAFRDELFGLAGTAEGDILRTLDGGLNWEATGANPAADSTITGFVFEEGQIIATHMNNSNFGTMKSLDDGVTWQMHEDTATFFYPQMYAANSSEAGVLYLGGMEGNGNEYGVIFRYEMGFWYYESVEQAVRDIDSHSEFTFCVGRQGAIYVNTDPSFINSVEDFNAFGFSVYPNPTSNDLNIHGSFSPDATYEMFDMSGRTVLNGRLGYSGTPSIDVRVLSNGMYSLVIQSDRQTGSIPFSKE